MKSSIISEAVRKTHWWLEREQELQALARETLPLLVYSEEILNETFFDLLSVRTVERVFQPVGAAPHPSILRKAWELGAGFRCTTLAEMDRISSLFPGLDPCRLLFAPPRATREEYEQALKLCGPVVAGGGAWGSWSGAFEGRAVLHRVRIGPGAPAPEEPSASLPSDALGIYLELQDRAIPPVNLTRLIPALEEKAGFLPDRHVLCLGGGAGLPIHPQRDTIVAPALSDRLDDLAGRYPGLRIWVEPGPHLVSHAGILLVRAEEIGGNDGTSGVRLSQDVLVVPNQGCEGSRSEGRSGSVPKFLRARRICQVRL